jgi:hypothetical protein
VPQEALEFEADDATVVNRFRNDDSERMIHCNTKLDDSEILWLAQCRHEAARRGDVFLPSFILAAGRFLGDEKGDVHVALERMRAAQAWRLNYFQGGPILDSSIAGDLALGILYFGGRDLALRPALVVRPSRIPTHLVDENCSDRFNRLFLFCMEYFLRYMVVPGRVENIVVILDLANISLSQLPSISSLMEMKTVMCQQDAGRVFRFYIVNMPMILRAVSTVVQSAMTERQRQKMRFVRLFKDMRKDFALHQLEVDLGGTAPIHQTFLPFPLPPGPFEAGYRMGARLEPVANVHRAFKVGPRGRLWDAGKSHRENTELEFTSEGTSILEECGLQAPQLSGELHSVQVPQQSEEMHTEVSLIDDTPPRCSREAVEWRHSPPRCLNDSSVEIPRHMRCVASDGQPRVGPSSGTESLTPGLISSDNVAEPVTEHSEVTQVCSLFSRSYWC